MSLAQKMARGATDASPCCLSMGSGKYGATAIPALGGRRGGSVRADCIENLGGRFLDVLQAFRQELRVTIVELNVILRR